MNILILNWRDIQNPKSGGAEVLTHEMAKRWGKKGNTVTQISEFFSGANKEEYIDNVHIIRKKIPLLKNLPLSFHLAVFFWYLSSGKGRFDVVIDQIHGIPFFTPLYVKEKKVALICEVAKEIWDVMFPFPLNILGKTIERYYFKIYSNIPFLTISSSTKADLLQQGIAQKHIIVLPMGLSVPKRIVASRKEKKKTVLFVGRLTKAKGVEDAILAFSNIKKNWRDAQLWIVGRGEGHYKEYLETLARNLCVSDSITFFGFVSQEQKYLLMQKAHVLVVPSMKEGWGLIVPEAGLYKTPAVVYDTHGLRDIVQNKKNGIVVEKDPQALSSGVAMLFKKKSLYDIVQKGAYQFAKKQNWDATADVALKVLSQ